MWSRLWKRLNVCYIRPNNKNSDYKKHLAVRVLSIIIYFIWHYNIKSGKVLFPV